MDANSIAYSATSISIVGRLIFMYLLYKGCLPLVHRVQNSNLSIRVNSKNNYSFQFSNK